MVEAEWEGKPNTGPGAMIGAAGPGMLAGIRVVEVADELAEYCGLLFAGLVADASDRAVPERQAGSRALDIFLAVQSQQALGCARREDSAGPRAPARTDRRRRYPARLELRRTQRVARARSRGAGTALSGADRRPHDAVRR